jgi:hypothetical protein
MSGEQRPGDWKFVCDFCLTGWASESVVTWNGFRVLRRFAGSEVHRHPQEEPYRPPHGEGQVPWARPVATATFRDPTDVTAADL